MYGKKKGNFSVKYRRRPCGGCLSSSVVHAFCVSIFFLSSSLLCRLCMHTFNFLSLKIWKKICFFVSLSKILCKIESLSALFFYLHRKPPTTTVNNLFIFSTVCVFDPFWFSSRFCKLCAHAKVDFSSGYSLHLILKVFFNYFFWLFDLGLLFSLMGVLGFVLI